MPRPQIRDVARPPGWKPDLDGVDSLSEYLRQIIFDKTPGDLKIPSVNLRKIALRDQQGAKRYRPRRSEPDDLNESGRSLLIDSKPTRDPIKSKGLCKHCEKITVSRLTEAAASESHIVTDELGGHHHSPSDLEQSALKCPLCRLFVIAFDTKFQALLQHAASSTVARHVKDCRFKVWARNVDLDGEMKDDEELQLLVLEWIDGKSKYLVELLMHADHDTSADIIGSINTSLFTPIVDSRYLSTYLPRVIRNCNERHVQCARGWQASTATGARHGRIYNSLQVSKLPSRVVVAKWEQHGRQGPFLWETNGAQGTYATLSHCWGVNTKLRTTTRATLQANMRGLNLSASNPETKTFREAIDVCRALGISYLWIDSLCIVQHVASDPNSNLDDWTWEALDMGRIYKDSALTIAATGASDKPANGLYGDRLRMAQYVELPFRMKEDDAPDGVFYVSLAPKRFDEEVSDSRLYTRGWVLQERLLSPRYLHFGKTQWYWQCRESTYAEIEGFEDGQTNIGADLGMSQSLLQDDIKFTQWWMKIVETYSRLDFTVESDRFIALQGLVSELKKTKPQEHYYGMWSNKLYIQLLWFIDPGSLQSQDVTTHVVAPPGESSKSIDTTESGENPKERATTTMTTTAATSTTAARPPYTPTWSWMSVNKPIGHSEGSDCYEPSWEEVERRVEDYPNLRIVRPRIQHRFKQASLGFSGSSVLIIRGQVQTVKLVIPKESPELTTKAKARALEDFDRAGPIARMMNGTYGSDHPTIPIQAIRGSHIGKNMGKCTLDSEQFKKAEACLCIRIADHSVVENGEEVVKSADVLMVFPQSRQQGQTGNIMVRRIGTGIIHDVGLFDGVRSDCQLTLI